MHVVIIDDNYLDRSRYLKWLAESDQSFKVTHISGVANLDDCLSGDSPDCIVLDYVLNASNGIEMLKIIRSSSHSHVPVVVFSAYDDDDVKKRFKSLGVNLFLHKLTLTPKIFVSAITDSAYLYSALIDS